MTHSLVAILFASTCVVIGVRTRDRRPGEWDRATVVVLAAAIVVQAYIGLSR